MKLFKHLQIMFVLLMISPYVAATNLCAELFLTTSIELRASEHADYDLADRRFIRAQNLIQLLITEKTRTKGSNAWTPEQLKEVESLFSQSPHLAKSVYRASVEQVLEWEASEIVFIIDQYLFGKYSALVQGNPGNLSLGPIPLNNFKWRSLLGGVLRVTGSLDLTLKQYGALSRVMTIINQETGSTTSVEFRRKIQPILTTAFPKTSLTTDLGIAEMLANLAQEKSCCGHGCAGCFKYYVKTMIRQISENARHSPSALPLSDILSLRSEDP